MAAEGVQVNETDEKGGKQSIEAAPEQQIGRKYKLDDIHGPDNDHLCHSAPNRA
jgi:hypothetical protein